MKRNRPSTLTEIAISEIVIGKRHRLDQGDIAELAASIEKTGLLHPIVISPSKRLIAGERRTRAYQMLGRERIPATIIDLAMVAEGEYAENTARKDFTPSELVSIARALEPIERAKAKERQRLSAGRGKKGGKPAPTLKGQALDAVGRIVGRHRRTIVKASAIVDAAKAEPKRFRKLQEDMDRTGRVNGPYKRLKVMRQAAAIRAEPPPYPNHGPYRVIVADPPWPYEVRQEDPSHRATHPYLTMSIAQICAEAEKVRAIAHDDCILWLWTTNHHMRQAFDVLDAWGFVPKTILTWVKDKFGTGDWLRGQTEHCILAVRGKPIVELTNQSTVLYGPLRANSQKPDEFLTFVESHCPSPRHAYLFARNFDRDGWDGHGDEAA
jgi:N6-adenosine-specific RNA methylase IME4/ParB-like chromosome segregation protein Spo0J